MKKYIIILLALFLTACKTTEKVKYVDRLVPKIVVEYCGIEIIKKCSKYIENNKDLIECYIFNENKIDEANKIIKLCKEKIEKSKEKE